MWQPGQQIDTTGSAEGTRVGEAMMSLKRWWANYRKQRRKRHAASFWNQRADYIDERIRESGHLFKWEQLVWQEMEMWAALGKPVPQDEFNFICDRRGFDGYQRHFLREYLNAAKLSMGPLI